MLDSPPQPDRVSEDLDATVGDPLPAPELTAVANRLKTLLTPRQFRLFDTYAAHLLHENKRANLTGERDRSAIYRRHFAESLAVLAALEAAGLVTSPLIDIGAGAGFPGLPIKIARPDLELTLLEATGKKVRFLEAIISELGLTSIHVVQGRAEELARVADFREAFPLALARAVAPLRALLEFALPFVQVGGVLAAPKGSAAVRETHESANALSELGGEILSIAPLDILGVHVRPTLIVVRKVAETPKRYPRRAGIPNKRPL